MPRRRLLGNRVSYIVRRRLMSALLTVTCNRCAAAPGERCITEKGATVPFHVARVESLYSRVDLALRLSPDVSLRLHRAGAR